MPIYLTARQAAAHVDRADRTVRRWRRSGLPFVMQPRVGCLIRVDDLEAHRDHVELLRAFGTDGARERIEAGSL